MLATSVYLLPLLSIKCVLRTALASITDGSSLGVIGTELTDVDRVFGCSSLDANRSVIIDLKYLIWPFSLRLILICLIVVHQHLIAHLIFVRDSGSVFSDVVFVYLSLLAILYALPVSNVLDIPDHVATKD